MKLSGQINDESAGQNVAPFLQFWSSRKLGGAATKQNLSSELKAAFLKIKVPRKTAGKGFCVCSGC